MNLNEFFLANAEAMGLDANLLMIASIVTIIVSLALIFAYWVCLWMVFEKAGKPGWATIIPIYNVITYLRVAGRPGWWLILLLIPLVNIIIALILPFSLARSFGKGFGFGLGLLLLNFIFILILAFDGSEWVGLKRQPAEFGYQEYRPAR